MGAYITKADILDQLPKESLVQITDDEGLGAVNDARVEAAIGDAEGEVDGYLSTRYTTPLSPVPPAVRKFTADIAVYNLFSRADQVPQERKDRYDAAVRFLLNVSKGAVSLGSAAPKPANAPGGVDITSNEKVFTRTKMEGF